MNYLKKLWVKAYLLYEKFQMIILGLFVFGIVEFLSYSEIIYVTLAMPEFAPIIITLLLGYGVYRIIKRRMKSSSVVSESKEVKAIEEIKNEADKAE